MASLSQEIQAERVLVPSPEPERSKYSPCQEKRQGREKRESKHCHLGFLRARGTGQYVSLRVSVHFLPVQPVRGGTGEKTDRSKCSRAVQGQEEARGGDASSLRGPCRSFRS